MLVTLFVSHFERSPLNAEAYENAIKRDIKRRVHKKGKTISINVFRSSEYINSKYVYEYKNRKRVREGRTLKHGGDFIRIPF